MVPESRQLLELAAYKLQSGHTAEVIDVCNRVLAQQKHNPDAMQLRALARANSGDTAGAVADFKLLLNAQPNNPGVLANLGNVLLQLGRHDEAVAALGQAAQLVPAHSVLQYNYANALEAAGKYDAAVKAYRRAIDLDSKFVLAHNNIGTTFCKIGDVSAAIQHFRRAIELDRAFAAAHANLGSALIESGQVNEGMETLKQALLLNPADRSSLLELVHAGTAVGDLPMAFSLIRHAIEANGADATLRDEFAAVLLKKGFSAQALEQAEKALEMDPHLASAHVTLATALVASKRFDEAVAAVTKAISLQTNVPSAWSVLRDAKASLCDWQGMKEIEVRVMDVARNAPELVNPLSLMMLTDDLELLRHTARAATPVMNGTRTMPWLSGRCAIAYVSADFGEHPVGMSMVEVLQRHDRARFELIIVSLTPLDGSEVSQQIRSCCDVFIDASQMTDAAVVSALKAHRTSIAVDLMGYTSGSRSVIFAMRAAPIQVSYLGFPGTLGAPYMDYIVADKHVIPPDSVGDYDEKIVWLPGGFFPTDTRILPLVAAHTRSQENLPDDGIVLCVFCNYQKLSHTVFDIWLEIVGHRERAVLWLSEASERQQENLRSVAAAKGVDPNRLVFATRVAARAEHLGRLTLADLFLDTWPYNAHSTARDALWAGVPVLTITGRSFASRGASSLLHGLNMGELVTQNFDDYRARALQLISQREKLVALRAQLTASRDRSVFSARRLSRELERAYLRMIERAYGGEDPAHIDLND